MKKLFLLSTFLFLLFSCQSVEYKKHSSSVLELRQLVQGIETSKQSNGFYFLIGGGFSSSETTSTYVKVFAKVEGRYRIIEMPIEYIRISIDNTLKTPNIVLEYESRGKMSDEELINRIYMEKIFVINCPEQYLPEKLLPIELTFEK